MVVNTDRHDASSEQHLGPFVKFIEEYGIISQYTIHGKPSMNSVVE